MAWDNCLTFALRVGKYYRERDHLLIRKSHWGWFPHFGVIFEFENYLIKVEYVPTKPRPRWIPPLFFKGEIRETYYRKTEWIPYLIKKQYENHVKKSPE